MSLIKIAGRLQSSIAFSRSTPWASSGPPLVALPEKFGGVSGPDPLKEVLKHFPAAIPQPSMPHLLSPLLQMI